MKNTCLGCFLLLIAIPVGAQSLATQRADVRTVLREPGAALALARELRQEFGTKRREALEALADTLVQVATDSTRPFFERTAATDALALSVRTGGGGTRHLQSVPRLRRVAEEATGATAGIAAKHLSLVLEPVVALGVLADLARQERREAAFAVLILADEFGDAGSIKLRSLVREELIANEVARAIAEAIAKTRGWNLAVPRRP